MFCENCGNYLPDNAQFCTRCGCVIDNNFNNVQDIPDTKIQLEVRPTYKFLYIMMTYLICFTFGYIIIVLKSGLFSYPSIASLFVFGFIIGINTIIDKRKYANLVYDFYNTKLVYQAGFVEGEIKYKFIKEISIQQTFMQNYFNLGNITILTSTESGPLRIAVFLM